MKAYAAGFLVLAGLLFNFSASEAKSVKADTPKLDGVAYSPFREDQAPDGDHPSEAQIVEDMKTLKDLAFFVRTYGLLRTLQRIPYLAKKAGIESYPGAHIGSSPTDNDEEIKRLLEVACSVHPAGLVVGNEVLSPEDPPAITLQLQEELIRQIDKVKSNQCVIDWGIPVGYSEAHETLTHPDMAGLVAELLAKVDLVLVNIHPYWNAPLSADDMPPIEQAAHYVINTWKALKDSEGYENIEVMIGETGWPSAGFVRGNAVPSEKNQQEFLKYFVPLASRENAPYFIFEAFDEKWKWGGSVPDTEAEAHWGLFYSDRTIKPRRFFETPPPLCEILEPARCGAGPGKLEKISGRVYGIDPRESSSYRVVLYALTNQWYVQPLVNDPLTSFGNDGSWRTGTHLGDSYACLLVGKNYMPPPTLTELPQTDGDVLAISVKECREENRKQKNPRRK